MLLQTTYLSLLSVVPFVLAAPSRRDESNPARRASLAEVISSCTASNTVALTFDDGPYSYEKDLADLLNEKGVKATFYVNGNNWRCIYEDEMIESLRYAYSSGHSIQSHTWAHKDLAQQSKDTIKEEMEKVDQALERILGVTPAYMRPPYGSYNDDVREVAASLGQSLVMWDFDSGDSTGSSADESKQAYADLINKHPNNVLTLNHETYNSTVYDVVPYAIDQFLNNGYKLVTVSKCLGGRTDYQKVTARSEKDSSWAC